MTTGRLLRETGITEHQLRTMIASRKVAPPPKDDSGRYDWPAGAVAEVRTQAGRDLRRREHRRQPAA